MTNRLRLTIPIGLLSSAALIGGLLFTARFTPINAQPQPQPTIIAPGIATTTIAVTAVPFNGSAQSAQAIPRCLYATPGLNPPPAPGGLVPFPCPPGPIPAPLPYPQGPVVVENYGLQTTILDQVAVTHLSLTLLNQGAIPAQGANIIPLPAGAAVSDLTLTIDGEAVQGQILDSTEAQAIYTQTVRQLRDPALLQYVGDRALQVQIFPIAPGDARTVTLQYTQLISADNGQIAYRTPLPLNTYGRSPIRHLSIAVAISSSTPLGTLYSPDNAVVISQADASHAQAGYEQDNVVPQADFQLYYTLAESGAQLPASLLTYRPDPTQDGYFMLLFAPPIAARTQAIDKDVILILDQSGSMIGQKWEQAQRAAIFVLQHLNPGDRFGALTFSTGYRLFNNQLLPASQTDSAVNWIQNQQADGGTDIDGALQEGLSLADPSRPTTILFMTDGQPTEGQTDLNAILRDTQAKAGANVRFFNFGVGDDVNTYLLDSLAANQHGATTYVHPDEDLEAAISNFYNRISAPVLTNVTLDTGSLTVSDQYPAAPLPDLYAGQQLIVAGRYHGAGDISFTLSGQQGSATQQFTLPPLHFPDQSDAQPFVASLWATRKIGYLLQQIHLHGENAELVQEVKQLSLQYGILTPYTTYLVQEAQPGSVPGSGGTGSGGPAPVPYGNPPIAPTAAFGGVPQSGSANAPGSTHLGDSASGQAQNLQPLNAPAQAQTGRSAVNSAQLLNSLAGANAPGLTGSNGATGSVPPQSVDGKTFTFQNGMWIDTAYLLAQGANPPLKSQSIAFGSDAYFAFVSAHPALSQALALGTNLIIVVGDTAVTITN